MRRTLIHRRKSILFSTHPLHPTAYKYQRRLTPFDRIQRGRQFIEYYCKAGSKVETSLVHLHMMLGFGEVENKCCAFAGKLGLAGGDYR